jgi:hypothetical protein
MELAIAKLILGLCDRFHCTPDVARKLDASVIRLLKIEQLGTKQEDSVSSDMY